MIFRWLWFIIWVVMVFSSVSGLPESVYGAVISSFMFLLYSFVDTVEFAKQGLGEKAE